MSKKGTKDVPKCKRKLNLNDKGGIPNKGRKIELNTAIEISAQVGAHPPNKGNTSNRRNKATDKPNKGIGQT